MAENPLVSIIVLNWNGAGLLPNCLNSLEKLTFISREIIVVDNGSTDRSMEVLNSFKNIIIQQLTANVGYASGNNAGIKIARGKYICTLNNDVVVQPDFLVAPMKAFDSDAAVGIISCRQMNYHERHLIDSLYGYPDHYLLFKPMGEGKPYIENPLYNAPGFVIGANGASAIYRKEMLDQIGGFDDRFFAYHEESDLCLRAFERGWKCLYLPGAVVYHMKSISFNKVKGVFRYHHERNRYWFIFKHFPVSMIAKNIFWLLLMEFRLLRIAFFKEKVFRAFLKSRIDSFAGFSQFRKERRENVPLLAARMKEYRELESRKKIAV
jgi:GT2 family glycosyltransferase